MPETSLTNDEHEDAQADPDELASKPKPLPEGEQIAPHKHDDEIAAQLDLEGSQQVHLTREQEIARAKQRLTKWHSFAFSNPPLQAVAQYADALLNDLNLIIRSPEFARLAVETALELAIAFERVKVGDLWHKTLINISGAIADTNIQALRQKLEQAMLRHNLYVGNPPMLDALVKSQERMMNLDYAAREDLSVAVATIGNMLANYDQGLIVAQDLLELAKKTDNKLTMARAYSILSQMYTYQFNAPKAFEYGQMVFSIGIALHDDLLITNGLHYMGLSFQISTPQRAFHYLEYALEYAVYAGDIAQHDYVWQTWATCLYYLGEYDEAVYFYTMALQNSHDRPYGQLHAAAMHGYGVSLTLIGRYVEAKTALEQALAIWVKHNRTVEVIYIQHALAELHSRMNQHVAALNLINRAIGEAEALGSRCNPTLMQVMLEDRKIYTDRSVNGSSQLM
jgi:tetratricopeptide (TPR) repeat protein